MAQRRTSISNHPIRQALREAAATGELDVAWLRDRGVNHDSIVAAQNAMPAVRKLVASGGTDEAAHGYINDVTQAQIAAHGHHVDPNDVTTTDPSDLADLIDRGRSWI